MGSSRRHGWPVGMAPGIAGVYVARSLRSLPLAGFMDVACSVAPFPPRHRSLPPRPWPPGAFRTPWNLQEVEKLGGEVDPFGRVD